MYMGKGLLTYPVCEYFDVENLRIKSEFFLNFYLT